jgi:large subunit ribosomal protein L29
MAVKKTKELREMSDAELAKLKADLSKRQMEIRFKAKIEAPENVMERREVRKAIAKINTILRERELGISQVRK